MKAEQSIDGVIRFAMRVEFRVDRNGMARSMAYDYERNGLPFPDSRSKALKDLRTNLAIHGEALYEMMLSDGVMERALARTDAMFPALAQVFSHA